MTVRQTLVAAVDQGSTLTKGAVYDRGGQRVDEANAPVEREVHGERFEHSAEELAASVSTVLDPLLTRYPVRAIGITCQRSTCLLWARQTGKALTRALSWQDRSQTDAAHRIARHKQEIARRTGLRLSPHYAALKLSRLLRLEKGFHPAATKGEIVAGTLDAFLIQHLTGRAATEPGHAGRTLLYNLRRNRWDKRLAEIFNIPLAALPALRSSAGPWGSYRGIPVTASAGDQQAALLGHGGWRSGITAAHFGTGAFVLTSTGTQPRFHRQLLSAALATTPRTRRYQLEGSVNSAGSAIDWAARLAGESLLSWSRRKIDPQGLPLIFPAFSGAAAPWWEPQATGVASGLGLETNGEQILAATIYATGMRILDCIEAFDAAGTRTRVLRVSGKLTRLAGLLSTVADAGQLRVEVSKEEETGLLGISRLALAGLEGRVASLEYSPAVGSVVLPRWPEKRAVRARRRWRAFTRQALAVGGTGSAL